MHYEVEKKYWIHNLRELETALSDRGIKLGSGIEQVDQYLAHPARDFGQTDEALRLRSVGDESFITYKGPRIDNTTKTRRELELALHQDTQYREDFAKLLELLGFEPVMIVRKLRRVGECEREGYPIEVCVDEIDQLGAFVELETSSDLEHLEQAKHALQVLAEELNLTRPERRSYLELMQWQLGANGP